MNYEEDTSYVITDEERDESIFRAVEMILAGKVIEDFLKGYVDGAYDKERLLLKADEVIGTMLKMTEFQIERVHKEKEAARAVRYYGEDD